MNEVYLRGKLLSVYEPIVPTSQPRHLVYQLRVSHKTAQQQVKFENYTINAWRNLATWAAANLQFGMDVFIRGHLSQRQSSGGAVTEVTALTMTPVAGRMQAAKPANTGNISTVPQQEAAYPAIEADQQEAPCTDSL